MLFPSNIFLFCFFPIMLFLYYVIANSRPFAGKIMVKNVILLAGSLIFYAYGEGWYVLLLVGSILFNYAMGILVSKGLETSEQKSGHAKLFMILTIAGNLLLLFVFKYLDFVIANVNRFAGLQIPLTNLPLPIGISFFTFQALSYVADIYRGKAKVQKNPVNVGLYIALFPQLIAGPIVRYESISKQMLCREESVSKFTEGILRFIGGLGKKVLLADGVALFADRIFNGVAAGGNISTAMAWLGSICYTLQIYYDFSGYSDMAIGLGKMFGFEFEENFNYPYISRSVTEFWRRWHISLSSWFRDYVYIPLGGNRRGKGRMYLNLLFVWLLTGIWHGAGWTFVLWGLLYFVILAAEKLTNMGKNWSLPPVLANCYTMLVVIISWTIFRSESLSQAVTYLKKMFGIGVAGYADSTVLFYLKDNWILFLCAILLVTPLGRKLSQRDRLYQILMGLVLVISLIYIWKGGYSPFIYFSF